MYFPVTSHQRFSRHRQIVSEIDFFIYCQNENQKMALNDEVNNNNKRSLF